MNPHYKYVAGRAGFRCDYCRAPEAAFNTEFDVEHVYPTARGGSDETDNLALACRACNARKGDAVEATDPETCESVPLFNPRVDRWFAHFRFDPERYEVIGITPAGRATVVRLDLNSPHQFSARVVWTRFAMFP